jgi:hypothetical protein
VRIIAGRFQACHRRRKKGEPKETLPEHRASTLAAVHGKRAKLYYKREALLNFGPAALALLTEITHREPRLSSRRVEDLYALLDKHGDEAMRDAVERAVSAGTLSVAGVRRALKSAPAGQEGPSPRVRRAQPRGAQRSFAAPGFGRAERGGAS